jgi:redox-sensitive bicupin YhaK (pirin superfamily)
VEFAMGDEKRKGSVAVWRRGAPGSDSYEGCYSAMKSVNGDVTKSGTDNEAGKMEKTVLTGRFVVDGAGVKLFRVFANDTTKLTDPFLLLDNFGSDRPEDYVRGFPWHPHRGIETVTYMIEGEVEHGDSIGNSGVIRSGDIQWMTAGGGIIHQEMPKARKGSMRGMQLWVNLPSHSKMMPPRYRGITANDVPVVENDGARVRIISGVYGDRTGPVKDLVVDVEYFDVLLSTGGVLNHDLKKGYKTFCYVLEGSGDFLGEVARTRQLIMIKDVTHLTVRADQALRFMLFMGMPLIEPIAWGGPIVMNTEEELETAFRELDEGTFIK